MSEHLFDVPEFEKGQEQRFFDTKGTWSQLTKRLPAFEESEFRVAPDLPPNPFKKLVVRVPDNDHPKRIPIAAVSPTYKLVQHHQVIDECYAGLKAGGIEPDHLDGLLTLTDYGEMMDFRVQFPEKYNHVPSDGHPLALQLECVNSVDESCKLMVFLGWFRFVCGNGLIIGHSRAEFQNRHSRGLDMRPIREILTQSLKDVSNDLERMKSWENKTLTFDVLTHWVDHILVKKWNISSACRLFHICRTGEDVEVAPTNKRLLPSQREILRTHRVPGASHPATNLFDVAQAMSWVASRRKHPEERIEWQLAIPDMLELFSSALKSK